MPVSPQIRRRRLVRESATRFVFAFGVWIVLTIPDAPGWTVSTYPVFHAIVGGYLLWNVVLAGLALWDRFALAGFAESSIVLDGLLLTVLVHFTGGGFSPFLLLVLPMVFGLYLSRNGRSALAGAVVTAACLFVWSVGVVRFIPVPPAFHVLAEPYEAPLLDNLVYLAAFAGLSAVVLALASILVMVLTGRAKRLNREWKDSERRREAADRELTDALRRLEKLSAVSNRMADVLRLVGQNQPPDGSQYRH